MDLPASQGRRPGKPGRLTRAELELIKRHHVLVLRIGNDKFGCPMKAHDLALLPLLLLKILGRHTVAISTELSPNPTEGVPD